jgi:hypothetical protein
MNQMERLKVLFASPVEVVSEHESGEIPAGPSRDAEDADIVALLSRRPCTVQGISVGLAVHANEVTKRLYALIGRGIVKCIRKNNSIFFDVA